MFFNLVSSALNTRDRNQHVSYESMALSTTDLVLILLIFIVPLMVPLLQKAKIEIPVLAPVNNLLNTIYTFLVNQKNDIARSIVLIVFCVISIVYSSVTISKYENGNSVVDDGFWRFSIAILIYYVIVVIVVITALTYIK